MFNKKIKAIIEKQQKQVELQREMLETQQKMISELSKEIMNLKHYIGLDNFRDHDPDYNFMQLRQDLKHKRQPRKSK